MKLSLKQTNKNHKSIMIKYVPLKLGAIFNVILTNLIFML